jgi:restriction system protein
MPVPTYDKFIEPILRYLAAHPDGAAARDVHDASAQALGLNDAERAELLPSGAQHVFKNRAGWGHDRLKRAGLSTSSRRGYWQLTEAGRAFAHDHPPPLPENVLETIAVWHGDVRLRPGAAVSAESSTAPTAIADRGTVSPDDRLEQALSELRQGVVAELLDVLLQVSPEYFETIVLDLLHKMGYGTSRADLVRVGRSGDGGIDGIISLDRLGLEKVYVQAKRWQNSVGRPEVQAFFGAIAGNHATKGVLITTASFSQQAIAYAGTVDGVVLVDGSKLADLMIEHEVGVTSRPVRVPKIDSDYFEE